MAHLGAVRRWEIYRIDLENRLLEHLGIDFEAEES
jgi:hypothetical protein